MEAMLEIRHFTKAYHGRKAVDDLSLTVEPGDIYGFIGHNGAGKTTTIRAVTGVLDFKEGDILVKGMSVRENPVGCKQITAYIPDNPDLYGYLTAIQYRASSRMFTGWSRPGGRSGSRNTPPV